MLFNRAFDAPTAIQAFIYMVGIATIVLAFVTSTASAMPVSGSMRPDQPRFISGPDAIIGKREKQSTTPIQGTGNGDPSSGSKKRENNLPIGDSHRWGSGNPWWADEAASEKMTNTFASTDVAGSDSVQKAGSSAVVKQKHGSA